MKATDFLQTYARGKRSEWEAAVVELARQGELAPLSWVEVPVSGGGHTGVVRVSHDVVAVGDRDDAVRMPLSSAAAQAVLNLLGGALLPTKKLAVDINQAVTARTKPITPFSENPGANLASFAKHSRMIDEQLQKLGNPAGLVGGHKKDLVVSNRTASGKEMIFGWYGPYYGQTYLDAYGNRYIQPLSDVHDHNYVDYSHGVRAVSPAMLVDGREMKTEDVYRDPALAALVSDEGPIKNPRYDAREHAAIAPVSTTLPFGGLARVYVEGLRGGYVLSTLRRRVA